MAWLCAESPVSANVVLVSFSSSSRKRVALSGSRSRVPGSCCPLSLSTPRGRLLVPSPRSAFSWSSPLRLLRSERGAIATDAPVPGARSKDSARSPAATANRGRPSRGVAGALPRGRRWLSPPRVGAQRGAELGCSEGPQEPPPQAPGAQRTKSPAPARSALSPAGEPPPAPTFPIAGAERSWEGVPDRRWRRGALRWPATRTRSSGPQLHPSWAAVGAGRGGSGQVAAACPGWAAAERGFGRSEPPPRGGGVEVKSRAERALARGQATRKRGRALPGLRAPRPAPELRCARLAAGTGGAADPPLGLACAAAARSSPPRCAPPRPPASAQSPSAPPVGAASPDLA